MLLNENYHASFGLEYNPFIKNNCDRFIFDSSDLKEVNYKLDYLFRTKGIGIITGNPGSGKTTSLRNYVKKLNKALYKVIYISMTTITDIEFYKTLISSFGYESKYRKCDNYALFQQIIKDYVNKKITPVIIIDEANYMSRSMLNDLKMLFNFNMDSCDNYVLILAGLPVLISNISMAAQEPLRQRIITSCQFDTLSNDEVVSYIFGKLEKAGGSTNIFNDGVMQAIINYSNGIPRKIDRVMVYALLVANNLKSTVITKDIIQKAIEQTTI